MILTSAMDHCTARFRELKGGRNIVARLFRGGDFCVNMEKNPASEDARYSKSSNKKVGISTDLNRL